MHAIYKLRKFIQALYTGYLYTVGDWCSLHGGPMTHG